MNISSPLTGCLVAAAAAVSVLGAAEVQMKAQRVSLFKNGYACVQMQGELPQGTQVEVKGLPLPLFGTLDWSVPEGVQVTHFEARKVDAVDMGSPSALLRACAGQEVRIVTDRKREYSGVLVSPSPMDAPPLGAFRSEQTPHVQEPVTAPAVVLRTARGSLVSLSASSIVEVEFIGKPQVPTPRPAAAELRVGLQAPAAGSPLQLDFVAQGLSWLPTYRLELQEDDTARLVGNVSVINRLMDMEEVQLELISGEPQLGEGLVTSPLVRLVGLKDFLEAVQTGRDWMQQRRVRSYDTYRSVKLADVDACWVESGADEESINFEDLDVDMSLSGGSGLGHGGSLPDLRPVRAEDLTYYAIPKFSSKRGETVERELFDVTVPCHHVYTCDLPDQHILQAAVRNERTVADIWHCLRLTNTGSLPWSRGVVSCHSAGRFAARSSLPFTSVGQESLLRMSKSMEHSITCREALVKSGTRRERGNSTPDVYQGQITLTNNSDRPMEMELTKAVQGTPTEASDAGQISITPAYSGNPRAQIFWKLHLEPHQEKTCTYTYQYATH